MNNVLREPLRGTTNCSWENLGNLHREGNIEPSFEQFGEFVRSRRRGIDYCFLKMKCPESVIFQTQ